MFHGVTNTELFYLFTLGIYFVTTEIARNLNTVKNVYSDCRYCVDKHYLHTKCKYVDTYIDARYALLLLMLVANDEQFILYMLSLVQFIKAYYHYLQICSRGNIIFSHTTSLTFYGLIISTIYFQQDHNKHMVYMLAGLSATVDVRVCDE
jgi:hypothetical protein